MLTSCKRNQEEDKGLGHEVRVVFSSCKMLSWCTIVTEKSEHFCKSKNKPKNIIFQCTVEVHSPDEKCFLFHLKNPCRSYNTWTFVLTFSSCRKTVWLERLGPGKQKITIHMLPNISRSKGNRTMKFNQLVEYNVRNIFLGKSCTKSGGETIPRTFWSKVLSFMQFVLLYVKLRAIKISWK